MMIWKKCRGQSLLHFWKGESYGKSKNLLRNGVYVYGLCLKTESNE